MKRPRSEGASITARTGDAHAGATRVVWARGEDEIFNK